MKKVFSPTLLFITISLMSFCGYANPAQPETAIFAGGCFWSMQHDLENVAGVINTTVGYTGGSVANPSYEQVSTGNTGHYESIQIVYDPEKISYEKLVDTFLHDIDPGDASGQFCDKGNEYHSAIFYLNDEQMKMAKTEKEQLIQSKHFNSVATEILPAQTFYPAEEYHQHYADKNPIAYSTYRIGCGRDKHLEEVWGKN